MHQRSLSLDTTINVIFGMFTVVLGTLSMILAVATWKSRHPPPNRQGNEIYNPLCKKSWLLTAADEEQDNNNATVGLELVSMRSTPTITSMSRGNNGDDSELEATGRATERAEN